MNRKVVLGIVFTIIIGGTLMFSRFLVSQKQLPAQKPKPEVKNYVKVIPVTYEAVPVTVQPFP